MEPILGASLGELRSTRTSVKWQVYGPTVVPAWVAEMDVRPCPAVVDAVTAAMRRGDTGYTWIEPYAAALSSFAHDRWGWDFDPATAVSAPDVMIALLDLLRTHTDEGDAVVVSPPVYNAFYGFIEGYRRRAVEAPLDEAGRLSAESLRRAFDDARAGGGRAAYVLCNPHNPTGTVHTRAELEMLAALAGEYGVPVIADEIHAPIVYAGSRFTPYLSVAGGERAITLMSASKAWNLAGLKCALAIPGTAAVDDLARVPEVAQHGASHVAAMAHTAAFSQGREWLDRLTAELDVNRRAVAAYVESELPGVRYRVPEATYLAWLDFRELGLGDDPAARILPLGGVALSHGPAFGSAGRGHARLNFATSPTILARVLDGIRTAVASA